MRAIGSQWVTRGMEREENARTASWANTFYRQTYVYLLFIKKSKVKQPTNLTEL